MDDLSIFCCQNHACADFGNRGHGNLTVCARYGPHQRRLLSCRSCKARFFERKGTPLFDTRLPEDKVVAVLAHIAEGVGVRKDTVVRYSLLAGRNAQQLHDELLAFSPSDP